MRSDEPLLILFARLSHSLRSFKVHDLLYLVFHLHDGIHHRHLCSGRLLLLRVQTELHELQLLPQQLVLLHETLAVLTLLLLVRILADRARHIDQLMQGRIANNLLETRVLVIVLLRRIITLVLIVHGHEIFLGFAHGNFF